MYYPHPFWGWPGLVTMVLLMVLFWGGLIVLALVIARSVREVRSTRSSAHQGSSGLGSAEQILAERFARGEIDEDTYRRHTQVLREHPGSGSAQPA
jgi:putative membrane protein